MHHQLTKLERRTAIAQIIRINKVTDQAMLQNLLREQGLEVSQGTLSRDLAEMQIEKKLLPHYIKPIYYLPEILPPSTKVTQHAGLVAPTVGYLSHIVTGQMIVVRTEPGFAHPLAAIIDSNQEPIIAGTIAGYDTLLIIYKEGTKQSNMLEILHRIIPESIIY